jgi:hypothetical protein
MDDWPRPYFGGALRSRSGKLGVVAVPNWTERTDRLKAPPGDDVVVRHHRTMPRVRPARQLAVWSCSPCLRLEARRCGQRAGVGAGEDRGVDLGGAAGRCGGSEILSKRACSLVCRLVMSRLIWPRSLESSPMLC